MQAKHGTVTVVVQTLTRVQRFSYTRAMQWPLHMKHMNKGKLEPMNYPTCKKKTQPKYSALQTSK